MSLLRRSLCILLLQPNTWHTNFCAPVLQRHSGSIICSMLLHPNPITLPLQDSFDGLHPDTSFYSSVSCLCFAYFTNVFCASSGHTISQIHLNITILDVHQAAQVPPRSLFQRRQCVFLCFSCFVSGRPVTFCSYGVFPSCPTSYLFTRTAANSTNQPSTGRAETQSQIG